MIDLDDEADLRVDDDGFVLIIAPDRYDSFIDDDWTLEQIVARLTDQMTAGSMFAAFVGQDGDEDRLTYGPPDPSEVITREASTIVDVGPGGLWLTDYTQITMAAQFADESPIGPCSVRLPVGPGRYEVRLQQMKSGALHLSVTSAPTAPHVEHRSVPWFEL